MTAKIIDGKAIAKKLRAEYHSRVDQLRARYSVTPALAVILVGENPASQSYVRNKISGCKEVGIRSELIELPASVTEEEVLDHIERLNDDISIHGILVQLPLPAHIRVSSVLERISVEKDVDGFHLYNMGGLVTGSTVFSPCTPYGVQKILEHENIPVEGRNVVVVGASNIVGKPTALMLMQQDATVVICHKKTRDLGNFTLLADILVVAAGVPNLIVPQIVKTGAVVIDVGIQSPARRSHRRRRGLRRREGKGVVHHAGARRRRPDDGDHAPAQHDSVGGTHRDRNHFAVPSSRLRTQSGEQGDAAK